MTDLTDLSLADAVKGLEKKEFSAVEITKVHLKKMEQFHDSP